MHDRPEVHANIGGDHSLSEVKRWPLPFLKLFQFCQYISTRVSITSFGDIKSLNLRPSINVKPRPTGSSPPPPPPPRDRHS